MDINSAKIELIKRILEVEDPAVIDHLLDNFPDQKNSVDEQMCEIVKEEIELGISQLDKGERVEFDSFMKKYRAL